MLWECHPYVGLVTEFKLQKLVQMPTRQENILDLVLTHRIDCVDNVEVSVGLPGCDHDTVPFSTCLSKCKFSTNKCWSYVFKKADFSSYNDLLSMTPWDCWILSESVDDHWICFKDILFCIANQCIPNITLQPWKSMHCVYKESLHLIRKKWQAHKLARRTNI